MLRDFSTHPRAIAAALVVAFLSLALAACGIRGPLKLPPAPAAGAPAPAATTPAAPPAAVPTTTPGAAPDKERAP
jgi:predicted small lipoprotein YifL